MLARTALARLRAKVPSAAARDVAQLSRQLQTAIARANSTNNAAALAPLTLAQFQRIRSYATATKTGAAKKAPVKKTTATKKPAPKKPAPKKTATTKKAAPKKKPAAKKKKAAARPKKELTDEQKERLAERKEKRKELRAVQKKKDDLKELKAIALEEPKQKPATAFQILMAETVQKDLKGTKGGEGIGPIAKAVSERYKNLSPAELEHYNHLANQAAEENKKAFQKWLRSFTPLEIKQANNARRLLRTKVPSYRKGQIQDDRLVKQPLTPFIYFFKERYSTGDFKNMPINEAAKLVSQEWKALGSSDKQKYTEVAEKDIQRYAREYKSTYGEEAPFITKAAAQASA
ncbi:hypothetical protein SLS57_009421 [Botryosphaeria dothidea]